MRKNISPVIWHDQKTWVPWVGSYLRGRLQPRAITAMRATEADELYDDDPGWLDLLASHLRADLGEVKEDLADALSTRAARTFHGCRTPNAGSYFESGLRLHRRDEQLAAIEAILADHPEAWRRESVQKRLEDIGISDLREGRSFVVMDRRSLLEFAGHYLIYGSEFILGAFREAGQSILKNYGTPTVIEINLPLDTVHDHERLELAGELLQEWCRQKVSRPQSVIDLNFSFELRTDLPPEFVVGHFHPAQIVDWHDGGRIYRPNSTVCALCRAPT